MEIVDNLINFFLYITGSVLKPSLPFMMIMIYYLYLVIVSKKPPNININDMEEISPEANTAFYKSLASDERRTAMCPV